jgi:hypothetical protein
MINENLNQNKTSINQPTSQNINNPSSVNVIQQSQTPTTFSNKGKKDSSEGIKEWIIIGLIIVGVGLFVSSFGSEFFNLEDAEGGEIIDFVGKLIIKIGLIISSILLIYFALFMERYDVTLRFGCLLVAGVIIAFEMLSFV